MIFTHPPYGERNERKQRRASDLIDEGRSNGR